MKLQLQKFHDSYLNTLDLQLHLSQSQLQLHLQ